MDVTEALKNRHSCRSFLDQPVPKETLEKVVEAALRTPSWQNSQPWDVYVAGYETCQKLIDVVTGPISGRGKPGLDLSVSGSWTPEIESRIRRFMTDVQVHSVNATMAEFSALNAELFRAPAIVFLTMAKGLGEWSIFDLGAFSMSVMLAAEEYGLHSMGASAFINYPDAVRQVVGIPDDRLVIFGIGLGYENKFDPINRTRTQRKGLETVTFRD